MDANFSAQYQQYIQKTANKFRDTVIDALEIDFSASPILQMAAGGCASICICPCGSACGSVCPCSSSSAHTPPEPA